MAKYKVQVKNVGDIFRRVNGINHCEEKPAVQRFSGNREWFVYGRRHRDSGPAIERDDDDKSWWLYGRLHRDDGPAIMYIDAAYWYLDGERITFDQHRKQTSNW